MQLNLQLGQKVIDTMPKPIAGHCYLYCSPTLDPIGDSPAAVDSLGDSPGTTIFGNFTNII